MNLSNVTVEEVGSKSVTTKFGPKPTYSFKANGEWFRTGFKNLRLNSGDNISFDYTESKYGKEVVSVTHNPTSSAAGPTTAAIPVPPRAPFSNTGKGVFPIPALDGQRAIVRQNSLSNAVNFITHQGVAELTDVGNNTTIDKSAKLVIELARKFEAYSCGDLDLAEVVAERNVKT